MTGKSVYGGKCLVNSLASKDESKDAGQRRVEFGFPILTVRTKLFSKLFDKLGSLRFSRLISWVALVIVPIVAGLGLYLVFSSLLVLLWNPAAGDAAREAGLGAYLLLPGINPFLPLAYGWFGIVCAIAIHEGAHGVAARSLGLDVKSSGLLFFLVIPIGAFVDVDEDQLKKASGKVSSRVMAAGVGGNVVVAAVCLIGVLAVVGGLAPVIDGVYVYEVDQGLPAEAAGLLPKDILVSVDNLRVDSMVDLRTVLDNKTLGDQVEVTVARGDMWKGRFSTVVNLTISENKTVMGIRVGDLLIEERLRAYQNVTFETVSMYLIPPALASGLVPFSDALTPFYTHSFLGAQWPVIANLLFWLWFININLAVFNALPIYPLDGGRMFNIALKGVFKEKNREKLVSTITIGVTVTIIIVLVMTVAIPFIAPFFG